MRRILFSVILSLTLSHPLRAQQQIEGAWEGAIGVMGALFNIRVQFAVSGDALKGTIDIPQQGARGLPLQNVRVEGVKVHFELAAGPGLATFDGEIGDEGIKGSFLQSGVSGTFSLQRAVTARTAPAETSAPPPYKEEEVRFFNDKVELAGTLTLPPAAGPHPAVIMISGSGAQNRDEEIFGFKPFRIIADHLTRKGVAVLRYDDRGVGGSTGNLALATIDDFAGDVLAALKFLQGHAAIDARGIGLCGHSEGGLVAGLVASRSSEISFVILMAGTSVPGDAVILSQVEVLARAGGVPDTEIQRKLKLQQRVYQVVRAGEGWDQMVEDLRQEARATVEKLPPQQRQSLGDVEAMIDRALKPQLAALRTPWFRSFIDFDPATALKQVRCPVLGLFGELDTQVTVAQNKEPLERALQEAGNKDHTIHIFPKTNHLFIPATTGLPAEYPTLKKEFVSGFLDLVSDWILQRVRTSRE